MRDSSQSEEHPEGKRMEFPTKGDYTPKRDKFAVINNEGDADFISKDGSNGPAIEYGISNGALIYELKIPLRVKTLESYSIGANPGDEVSICLELQGGERPEGMGRGMNMMNEQIGDRGMPGGGGPGGPPPGGPGKSQEKEIWIKIHLATNAETLERE